MRPVRALLCLFIAVLMGVTLVPAASAAPPAPLFGPGIDGYAPYVQQSTCDPVAKPGVVDFAALLGNTYGRPNMGITRACNVGGTSEHKEGRALDYPFNANDPGQRDQGYDLVNWLLATDQHGNEHALARRLGIMYIIWDHRIWSTTTLSWRTYNGTSPHTDHIHFSFGWPGARQQTTWWQQQIDMSEGDITGDGYADLTAVTADGRLAVYGNGILLPANQGRPFQNRMWQTDNTNWGTDARSITTAEVTGDGYADFIVLTNSGKLQIYGNGMLVNPGGAPFTGVYDEYDGWGAATHIAAGDVNRDGWADLAVTIGGQLQIYLNTRQTGPNANLFQYASWTYGNWGADVVDIALGDVTGDSYADLTAVRTDGTLTVFGNGTLVNTGGVPFVNPTWSTQTAASQIHDISVSRITNDGYADLMVITTTGDLQVYPNVITDPAHNHYFTGAQWIYTGWDGVQHIA